MRSSLSRCGVFTALIAMLGAGACSPSTTGDQSRSATDGSTVLSASGENQPQRGQTQPNHSLLASGAGGESECDDDLDNDGDNLIDCDDPDCALDLACTRGPTITCPPDRIVECDGSGNEMDLDDWLAAVEVDSVCQNLDVSNDFAPTFVECANTGTITVTWVATDDCGKDSCSAEFTVEDSLPPVISGAEDVTVDCDGAGNAEDLEAWLAGVTIEEMCGEAQLDNDFDGLTLGCGGTGSVTVTWIAFDGCGRQAAATATFTIRPETLVITGAENLSVPCDGSGNVAELDAWLSTAAVDASCGTVELTNDFTELSDDCGATGSATVTWTATDECGGTATATATFTIVDEPPVISGVSDTSVPCDGSGNTEEFEAWLATASASDVCGSVELSNDLPTTASGDCTTGSSTMVTWTAVDECGKSSSLSATFTIEDLEPGITAPADLTVECDRSGHSTELDAWLGGAVAETCTGGTVTNDFMGLGGGGCGGGGSTTVTWTVTDECDRTASDSATFTIRDSQPPTLTVPADLTVECDGSGNAADLEAWLGEASAADSCTEPTLSNDFAELSDECGATGTAAVTWEANDGCNSPVSGTANFTILDSTAPVVSVNGDTELTLECGVDEYEELGATATDDCDGDLLDAEVGGDTVDVHTPGTYVVQYSATDACGNEAEAATRTVEVIDTLAPEITVGELVELWPPNHKYHELTLSGCVDTVVDACEGEIDVDAVGVILSIYSDEPENSIGDGNTTDDIVIIDEHTFKVRAERRGGSNGRVYGITFEVADASGNVATATCFVGVPHDQSGDPPVDDGADAGYTVP